MKSLKESHGASKISIAILLLFVGAVVYTGFKILPFYYYYYDIMSEMHSVARVSDDLEDREMRARVWAKIKEAQIPKPRPESLIIERTSLGVKMSFNYTEVFYIRFRGKDYIIHTFFFNPKIDYKF